ncbi:YfiT family bacillithiol transferase [Echinicola rosea]|nr:putative metal-dependent hydrolase [Echinicola rosea]
MNSQELEKLKYPIGQHHEHVKYTMEDVASWIADIAQFPQQITSLTENLTAEELNWLHRPDGWTIKQLVHHCADSHMNSFMRFKLALTEDTPKIKPYHEDRWTELPDSTMDDISNSLMIISGLHRRWAVLLNSLSEDQLHRTYYHPEHRTETNLGLTTSMYSWHCKHHLAHIEQALAHKGTF